MERTVYVNGHFLPESEATISVFDRGFLMADAVYEVTTVIDGKLIDFDGHMERLRRSLGELGMREPDEMDELITLHREILGLNNLNNGRIYLQVTRGIADRDFSYDPEMKPSVVLFSQEAPCINAPQRHKGIKVATLDDIRWKRRDIKTTQLLAPSLAKMEAKKRGADDAWMVEDGYVTEGTSNNAFIVKDGKLITRPLSTDILHGITRAAVLRYAAEAGIELEERAFTVEEALEADEAFITSASAICWPVTEIDGQRVGGGQPGPVARRVGDLYLEEAMKRAR
ncbi:D-amino-acid transaminase [Paracoccaceae bacterium GXU_MW_L88]